MIIYKLTDRIPVSIGDIKFWFSPLSYAHRIAISECTIMKAGEEVSDNKKIAFLSIKYGLKEVEGIKAADGSDYALEFDADGSVSDDSLSELMLMDYAPKLVVCAAKLVGEIREHEIEGVKIDLKGVKNTKKKVG